MKTPPARSSFAIGHWAPLLLAAAVGLETLARFIPIEAISFRAWEAAARYATGIGPFTPNLHYDNPRAYGDLANLGNLPQARVYRREIFNADSNGFRVSTDQVPRVLVLGDSFAMGCSVNDDQILSARLQRRLGVPVSTLATMNVDMTHIVRAQRALRMNRGLVLLEFLSRSEPPEARNFARQDPVWSRRERVSFWIEQTWRGFWKVNPLQILCEKAVRGIQDDRWLPGGFARSIVRGRLKNGGGEMLFYPEDISLYDNARRSIDVSGFVRFKQELRARGFDLLVLLVPDKYTVYEPLLEGGTPAPAPSYLTRVEEALKKADVPVVNAEPVEIRAARAAISRRATTYWMDDTHWNADGIAAAADAAAPAIAARLSSFPTCSKE